MADLAAINEESSSLYTAILKDETGAVIDGTALDSLTLTVYEVGSGTIVNSRDKQNVKNVNGVTISALGVLVWTLAPADNAMITSNAAEQHAALFVAKWASSTKQCTHRMTWLVRNFAKYP